MSASYGTGVKRPRILRRPIKAHKRLEAACFSCSEIRLIRGWYRGFPSMVVCPGVFGTDQFRPLSQGHRRPPIGYGRGPRRRKDAFVLDGEVELQSLALVFGIKAQCRCRRSEEH